MEPDFDSCGRSGDLVSYESLTSLSGFVIEEDSATAVEPIRLAVVHNQPVPVEFGTGVWGS